MMLYPSSQQGYSSGRPNPVRHRYSAIDVIEVPNFRPQTSSQPGEAGDLPNDESVQRFPALRTAKNGGFALGSRMLQ